MSVKKWMMFSVVAVSLLFVLSACKKKVNPFPNHEGGKIFQGLKNVKVKCAGCHGALGGGGMGGPSLIKAVKNLTPDQFVATVTEGRAKMPKFGGILEEDEILQIVDWLKKLPAS